MKRKQRRIRQRLRPSSWSIDASFSNIITLGKVTAGEVYYVSGPQYIGRIPPREELNEENKEKDKEVPEA